MKGLLPSRRPPCTLWYLGFLTWKASYANRNAGCHGQGLAQSGTWQVLPKCVESVGDSTCQGGLVAGKAEQEHLGPDAFHTHEKGPPQLPITQRPCGNRAQLESEHKRYPRPALQTIKGRCQCANTRPRLLTVPAVHAQGRDGRLRTLANHRTQAA